MAVSGPAHIGIGDADQRQRQRLDDEIIDRDLIAGLPSLSFGAAALIASRRLASVEVAIGSQIKMRYRLACLTSLRAMVVRIKSCGISSKEPVAKFF
jgi:hypothetical protein